MHTYGLVELPLQPFVCCSTLKRLNLLHYITLATKRTILNFPRDLN